MTDTPPSKRRFWQIHLSTAVVLSITAGLLVWLNMPRIVDRVDGGTKEVCGWPFELFVPSPGMPSYHRINMATGILQNFLIDLALFLAVLNAREYLIRRRAKP